MYRTTPGVPDFLKVFAMAAALALVALIGPISSPALAQMGPDYWEVTGVAADDTLNIRSGPGTSYKVVARAPNGSIFRNLGCEGSGSYRWCHLETPDGHTSGWAAGRFLRESGAPTKGTAAGKPELHVRSSDEVEIRFSSGCTVLYNPAGREIAAGSSCSRAQKSSAADAVKRYFAENAPGSDHAAVDTKVNASGRGTIIGGDALQGKIFGHREGAYAVTLTGGGLTCTGLLNHAPGVVKSETTTINCTDGSHGTAVLVLNRNGKGSTLTMTLSDGTGGYVLF